MEKIYTKVKKYQSYVADSFIHCYLIVPSSGRHNVMNPRMLKGNIVPYK